MRPRQAIAYPCSDREKHQEGCSNRRKGNCWAEIMENCEGDKSMKSRTGRKRKRPSISGGLSDCCSLRRSNGRRQTENTRVENNKKKSMVPVSFFDLSLFSHGTSLVCFIQVPYTTSASPHPCCLSSLQSSCFFSLPLSIPFPP